MIASFEVIPPQPGNQTQRPTPAPNPNPPPTAPNPPLTDWLLFVIFLIIIAVVWKLKHRGRTRSPKERQDFSEPVKVKTLEKQGHRCADCNKVLPILDWHHRNGDRSDNRESNCLALCPNCHANRTRRSVI
jgi:hypothetical protein